MSTPNYTIRSATVQNARGIYRLIRDHSDNLIPRSINDIVQNLDRFIVAVLPDETIIGTTAYTIFPEIGDPFKTSVEIQSVCVEKNYRHHGIGHALVKAQLRRVNAMNVAQVIVLTFTPDFFASLGFHPIDKSTLMHKIYIGCINCTKHESPFTCPEVAMALTGSEIAMAAV